MESHPSSMAVGLGDASQGQASQPSRRLSESTGETPSIEHSSSESYPPMLVGKITEEHYAPAVSGAGDLQPMHASPARTMSRTRRRASDTPAQKAADGGSRRRSAPAQHRPREAAEESSPERPQPQQQVPGGVEAASTARHPATQLNMASSIGPPDPAVSTSGLAEAALAEGGGLMQTAAARRAARRASEAVSSTTGKRRGSLTDGSRRRSAPVMLRGDGGPQPEGKAEPAPPAQAPPPPTVTVAAPPPPPQQQPHRGVTLLDPPPPDNNAPSSSAYDKPALVAPERSMRKRKAKTLTGLLTTAQGDIRAATMTVKGLGQSCKPFDSCSFEEQLVHPAIQHIPYRSRLRRGRKRGKDEIKFLSSSIARVAANDMTLANFKASSDELPGHWLSGLGRALPFNTYLRRIDFNNNDVEDGDVESLCVGLASNRSVLEVAVGNSRLTETSANSFARMLKINTTLLALNITGKKPSAFNLGDKVAGPAMTALGAAYLSEALEANKTLTSLVLARHKMWDVGAAAIARALRHNHTLTHLVLSRNRIGDPGAKALGLALAANTGLTAIDLSGNHIGDAGATDLSGGLHDNRSLRTLDLSRNEIGELGAKELFVLLASHNPYLTHVGLTDNKEESRGRVEALEQLLKARHHVEIATYSLHPEHSHLDQFKDSGVTILRTRTYTDSDPRHGRTPYRFPNTKSALLYPRLPCASRAKGEPPVSFVTRENFRMRQRQERAGVIQNDGYKKWKAALLKTRDVIERRDWFPAKQAWAEWRKRLVSRYCHGIDRPATAEPAPTDSPILARAEFQAKTPRTVRPPGFMSEKEAKALAKGRRRKFDLASLKDPVVDAAA